MADGVARPEALTGVAGGAAAAGSAASGWPECGGVVGPEASSGAADSGALFSRTGDEAVSFESPAAGDIGRATPFAGVPGRSAVGCVSGVVAFAGAAASLSASVVSGVGSALPGAVGSGVALAVTA
jgi:hypothetical protein